MNDDLISRSALRKEIDCCDIETFNDKFTICEQIANAPTVEVVPVLLRCGECAHGTFSMSVDCAYKCGLKKSPCYGRVTYADFGCLYGEPKE